MILNNSFSDIIYQTIHGGTVLINPGGSFSAPQLTVDSGAQRGG